MLLDEPLEIPPGRMPAVIGQQAAGIGRFPRNIAMIWVMPFWLICKSQKNFPQKGVAVRGKAGVGESFKWAPECRCEAAGGPEKKADSLLSGVKVCLLEKAAKKAGQKEIWFKKCRVKRAGKLTG